MAEIRFGISKKLSEHLSSLADELGVDKSDYVKGLVLEDLKKRARSNAEKKE